MNKSIDERVKRLARPASTVKPHSRKIVMTISRSDIAELNSKIVEKIKQNARERRASFEEARNVIVKD